jgi:hypothetical protein
MQGVVVSPGNYEPTELGACVHRAIARLCVLDVPVDENGERPARKWFAYAPMDGEFYYVNVGKHDARLWRIVT